MNLGSTGRACEETGKLAISLGWDSYIAFGRKNQTSSSKLIKIGSNLDILLHGFITRLFDRHGFGSSLATRKLIDELKKIKPDIIHLHNLHGYYLNIEILFDYLAKVEIPVVWTLHDCWAFTGHCSHFDFIGCEKWKNFCFSCPQKNKYPTSNWLDNSERNYLDKKRLFNSVKNMTIVSVSSWLDTVVKKSFLQTYPNQIIKNGIDLNVFSPQNNSMSIRNKLGIGNKFMMVGSASTWVKNKGFLDYIKLSKVIDKDIKIVLIGLSQKKTINLPKNIIGLRKTDKVTDLVEIYSAADVILNLSKEETFGLTTVEGFACGTPSIVYNCTASPELITRDTGFVVEEGNIDGLTKAIYELKSKGKATYSIACRKHAEKNYNKEEKLAEYFNLYDRLLYTNCI